MLTAASRCVSAPAPSSSVMLCHGAPASISTTAPPLCSRSATAPRPAASCSVASPGQQQLCHHGASASNKPHPAEKSTPIWLAIWHTWAGFANSQLRCAIFQSNYSCKCPSPLLPPWSCCSDIANLSAHLHRLPTPPPYLRRMRLSPGRDAGIRWVIRLSLGRASGVGCWMMRLQGKEAGVGWQMMLLVVRGRVPANHRARSQNANT